jgi:DNA-binding NtrC family response regulator
MEDKLQYIKKQFDIIGNSKSLNRALEIAIQVAPTDMSVLITGESGTGKEAFAKIIHKLSSYKHGNFIAINCGAIPKGTIDSELFGHEKGAFTDASEERKGYFEEVDGGTIFLDEIGDMPLSTQVKLLRVLEYGEFIRVGSSRVRKIKVRITAATNVNLLEAISKKKFREDLYYRLNTVPIRVPSLHERSEDIELLFRKFAAEFSEKYSLPKVTLTKEAIEFLMKYRFPGNIRELKSIVERMSILETTREISEKQLSKYLTKDTSLILAPNKYEQTSSSSNKHPFENGDILYKILFDLKKELNGLKEVVFNIMDKNLPNLRKLNSNHEDFKLPASFSPDINLEVPQQNELKFKNQVKEDTSYNIGSHSPTYTMNLNMNNKELIIKALENSSNSKKQAAKLLGISERTLYRKIKQYKLDE